MIYLILAIICSCTISIVMRISSKYVPNSYGMLCSNYLICFLVGTFHVQNSIYTELAFNDTLGFGLLQGILYLVSFVLFQRSIQKNGMILSSLYMKLGVIVPLIISIFLFQELPSFFQWIAILLAMIAIIIMNRDDQQSNYFHLSLVLLLLMNGLGDAMGKIFETYGDLSQSSLFLIYTFFFAFLLCILLCIKTKEKITFKMLLFGICIGIPNYYSSFFLLKALTYLPGIIVYPCFSIATILSITTVGMSVFKERLKFRQVIACLFILISLYLLNL